MTKPVRQLHLRHIIQAVQDSDAQVQVPEQASAQTRPGDLPRLHARQSCFVIFSEVFIAIRVAR